MIQVCQRPERDERGRILPGHSGNPRGRPKASKYARLFAAAAELGAVVVLMPQTQAAPARASEAHAEAVATLERLADERTRALMADDEGPLRQARRSVRRRTR